MGTNQILPFCPTDTGTNLETQVDYAADTNRTNGNQPGIAKSKLVNKVLRQAAWMASQLAQYMVNVTGQDVLDDQNSTNLLATMGAAFQTGLNPVAKTSAYTAAAKDFVVCSAASWSLTLPDASAAGVKGLMISIQHGGTSLTQQYTLLTTSAQTIGGIASGAYILCTNGETLTVISDGANWKIVSHQTATGWISAGALSVYSTSSYTFTISSATVVAGDTYSNNGQTFTVSASGTVTSMPTSGTGAPTSTGTLTRVTGTGPGTLTFTAVASSVPVKGATPQTDQVYYMRQGNRALVRVRYGQTTAGTGGGGEYLFNLPQGLSIDLVNSGLTAYMGSIGTYLLGVTPAANVRSSIAPNVGIGVSAPGTFAFSLRADAFIYSSSSYRLGVAYFSSVANAINNSQLTNVGGAAFGYAQVNGCYEWTLDLPIAGWQP